MPLAIIIIVGLLACLGLMTASQVVVDRYGPLRKWLLPIASGTLRGGVARSLVVLALVPGLVLTVSLASKQVADREKNEIGRVTEAAEGAATQVEAFLSRHIAGVRSVGEAIELDDRPSDERVGQWLLRYHPIYPDFLTMMVADASGRVMAATRWENGAPALVAVGQHNVSDRSYFQRAISDGGEFVSEAFRGRGLGTDPLIAISSRIDVNGRPYGVVQGALNLRAFERLDDSYRRLLGARVVLLDAAGTVIYAHASTGYRFLEASTDELEKVRQASQSVSVPDRKSSGLLRAGYTRTARDWSVVIFKPLPTLAQTLQEVWWVTLAWLGVCLLFAIALAIALARRVAVPLDRLIRSLNVYFVDQRSPFRSLAGLPQEYLIVFRHLHKLVVRLAGRHRKLLNALEQAEVLQARLHNVLELREQEVEQRTRELARANQELEVLSRTDALTQLFNRRWFEHEYEHIWRAAARGMQPLSIVLLDVDFFKRYNDCYGHPEGDEVLRKIAQALRSSLRRPQDIPARYGGEEFAVVLGDTDLDGAREVAERVRSSIDALTIEHRDSPHGHVTVSIGVCSVRPSAADERDRVLSFADKMLYEAKALGRNHVSAGWVATLASARSTPLVAESGSTSVARAPTSC